MEDEYIANMSEKERIAYLIAKDHLETSFDIQKSIGYQTYKQKCIQEK